MFLLASKFSIIGCTRHLLCLSIIRFSLLIVFGITSAGCSTETVTPGGYFTPETGANIRTSPAIVQLNIPSSGIACYSINAAKPTISFGACSSGLPVINNRVVLTHCGQQFLNVIWQDRGDNGLPVQRQTIASFTLSAPMCSAMVAVPDANLEMKLRQILNKPSGGLTVGDMSNITAIEAVAAGIRDLEGLQYATNLTSLNLYNNQISDLRPIANLSKLTKLALRLNQLVDISPVASLTNLVDLDLARNQISNLTPIANLKTLTALRMEVNNLVNVSALTGLVNLTVLHISFNQIADLNPMKDLLKVGNLDLRGNKIIDLSPLVVKRLNFGTVYLAGNQIVNLAPIREIKAGNLTLQGNALSVDSCTNHIPYLRAKGVTITSDCK